MAKEFMHKNKLQEYAQRSAIPLPIYNTVNEGYPHAPRFRSSVIVDGSKFTSNCTFSNKKAAEQYVAKCALEAIRSFIRNNSLSLIPNNLVIFKCILNEYAVKMNLKLPTYVTCKGSGIIPMFVSSVSFDNKTFKGEFGNSKKEAEQIGARAVIESILGNSDSATVMTQIIKSKAKYATASKLNGSSSSEIGNAVMIGPMVHQTNVNLLEMQSTPNRDPFTSFQPCYPEPPAAAALTNASAGHSVPSETAVENLCQHGSKLISTEKYPEIPDVAVASFQPCYPEPPPAVTLTNASAGHSVPSGIAVEDLCQHGSELISNEKCPEIPDVAIATGRSTSEISKNAHSEQNILHPDQVKSEVQSDDSGNHSSESQGNASKKHHNSKEDEQSPLKKARVDEVLAFEPHAPQ